MTTKMSVKLLRIDGENSTTIELTEKKNIFGRGHILLCQDKNISRTHAEIEILQDAVRVRALHLNPCFYKKRSMDGFKILKKGDTVDLAHGEILGLLPNNFWFQIKFHEGDNTEERNEVEAPADSNETKPVIKVEPEQNGFDSRAEENTQTNTSEENTEINTEVKQECAENRILSQTEENEETNTSDENKQTNTSEGNKQTNTVVKQECAEKRKLSQTDEMTDSGIPTKVKPTGDEAMASTSGVNEEDDPDSADQTLPAPADNTLPPVVPPQRLGRERCFYGANCFRRNPAHKAQFSHPGDGDYGAGDLGECPFGVTCTRHDPRHWTTHTHPPGATQPGQGESGERTDRREAQDHYIEIKVWIKTIQHEGEKSLLVKPHMTINELATECEQIWGIPVTRQHWVIGLMHFPDDITLEEAAGPGLTSQFSLIIENVQQETLDLTPQQERRRWQCSVCQTEFGPRSGVLNLTCGHAFCLECIIAAVERASYPPIVCVRSGCYMCDRRL